MRLSIVAAVCVAGASTVAGVAVWRTHEASCSSDNAALTVLRRVLDAGYTGPHHFNDPADVAARREVYQAQIRRITAAECR